MQPTVPEINVGVMAAHSPDMEVERLEELARKVVADATPELERATRARWSFDPEDATRLSNDDPRRPADLLDEATLRMVEGPYDVVVVVTDVALVSHGQRVVAGLASPVARVVVLSTRKLVLSPRGEPFRSLEAESVRRNAAALLLHLLGHVMGLGHVRDPDDAMAPFAFREDRRALPSFGKVSCRRMAKLAAKMPEREMIGGGALRKALFHLASAMRHPGQALLPVLRSRAPFMALSLPSLATAAVVPTFILIFTAEIWDVGMHMPDSVAWSFAPASILAAAIYLTLVLNLFFPHREKRVVTEHMAVVNTAIFLTVLLAIAGLFVMVGALMLLMELWVFPDGLIATWPTLEDPVVDVWDRLRIPVVISTIGVLTGALAGGLESRAVIRHLALFNDDP